MPQSMYALQNIEGVSEWGKKKQVQDISDSYQCTHEAVCCSDLLFISQR